MGEYERESCRPDSNSRYCLPRAKHNKPLTLSGRRARTEEANRERRTTPVSQTLELHSRRHPQKKKRAIDGASAPALSLSLTFHLLLTHSSRPCWSAPEPRPTAAPFFSRAALACRLHPGCRRRVRLVAARSSAGLRAAGARCAPPAGASARC